MDLITFAVLIQNLLTIILVSAVWIKKRSDGYHFLLIFLLAILLDFSYELLVLYFVNDPLHYINTYPSSFRFLKGPSLFLLARFVSGFSVRTRSIFMHYFPFAVAFVFHNLVLLNILTGYQGLRFFYSIYSKTAYFYLLFYLSYLLATLITLFRHPNKEFLRQQTYLKYFIIYLLSAIVVYWALHQFRFNHAELRTAYTLSFLIQFSFVIFFSAKINSHEAYNKPVKIAAVKYVNSPNSQQRLQELFVAVSDLIKREKLFLDPELTLVKVAQKMNLPKEYISQAFNVHGGISFLEFINSLRINEYEERLKKVSNTSITDLIYESGFRSKTTFYKYLKKHSQKSDRSDLPVGIA
jgi:AraC-like DNA-binding protein